MRASQPPPPCHHHHHDHHADHHCGAAGEGKPRELDARPTVFKLAPESSYAVKMKASKALVNDAARRFGYTPFTLRAFADDKDKRKASEAALVSPPSFHLGARWYPPLCITHNIMSLCLRLSAMH